MEEMNKQELEATEVKDVEIIEAEDYEFNQEKTEEEVALKLQDSPELLAIAKKIDIEDTDSIMSYGAESANEISQFADKVLKQMKMTKIEESSRLMKDLNAIMEEFDIKDFQEEKQGFFGKLFSNAKDSVERLFNKYTTMGSKVDRVYQELKVYEAQINESNEVLDGMFASNMQYYEDLQKHINAGKMAIDDANQNKLAVLDQKAAETGEQIDVINANNARQAVEMLNQRVYDLELAKAVALQSLPQIKLIQKGNYDLMRKINSAFIVTLPIFKQGITQAIALKRQKIQSEAMAALDEKTNELLIKNAMNTAEQSKKTAELASGSSIKIETLQQSWEIIVRGIQETKQIQQEAIQKREEGSKALELMQAEYNKELKKLN